MDLFCSNCGNQLREGAKFCNKCGNRVNTEPENTFQNQQIQDYNQFQNNTNTGFNPYSNINQPNFSNNYPSNEYQQPNYPQKYTKEPLTWGTALGNYWACRFSGRCSRWEWWFTVLTFYIPLVFILVFVLPAMGIFPFTYIILFLLIQFIPNLAFWTRRLHDCNMTGWWQLLFFIPLIIGFCFGFASSQTNNYSDAKNLLEIGQAIEIGGSIITFIFSLIIVFSAGTPGPNQYGPPSKY